jgi:N-methylhydantoinase B
MLASRQWLPLPGAAGGRPGATTSLAVRSADGVTTRVSTSASGVVITPGESFEFACASGGGFGDPLDREPTAVAADVDAGRIDRDAAAAQYGVVLDPLGLVDVAATDAARDHARAARLAAARPAIAPVPDDSPPPPVDGQPLYPGVVQHGQPAMAALSGAPLAIAPAHWTDGCPFVQERHRDRGPEVVLTTWLDPRTGRALHVDVTPAGAPRAFSVLPRRWTGAG